jgi:hypothetical protein
VAVRVMIVISAGYLTNHVPSHCSGRFPPHVTGGRRIAFERKRTVPSFHGRRIGTQARRIGASRSIAKRTLIGARLGNCVRTRSCERGLIRHKPLTSRRFGQIDLARRVRGAERP